MPLKKLTLKPGVNRENTRYTNENGWYECDKIRFRQGTPEKLGGWARLSSSTFAGICRSLWNWFTLSNLNILGVGTNEKFYLELGGAYYDITPIRGTATLTNPFATTNTLTLVTVTDVAHGCVNGDYVTFSGATAVGGLNLNNEYQVTVIDDDSYTITAATAATSTATGGGTVTAAYQINIGPAFVVPLTGWGAGPWGFGTWGNGSWGLSIGNTSPESSVSKDCAVSESATALDANVVAGSTFKPTLSETARSLDTVVVANTLSSSVSETGRVSEVVAVPSSIFGASVVETTRVSDNQNIAAWGFGTWGNGAWNQNSGNSSPTALVFKDCFVFESGTASNTIAAAQTFGVSVSDVARASDIAPTVNLAFISGVSETAIADADNVSYAVKLNYIKNLIEVLPETIELPSKNEIQALTLEEKIKQLLNYVVLIKIK
jgi:hypothetical protein